MDPVELRRYRITLTMNARGVKVDLPAADRVIQTWLIEPGGESRGAYFVTAERLAAE